MDSALVDSAACTYPVEQVKRWRTTTRRKTFQEKGIHDGRIPMEKGLVVTIRILFFFVVVVVAVFCFLFVSFVKISTCDNGGLYRSRILVNNASTNKKRCGSATFTSGARKKRIKNFKGSFLKNKKALDLFVKTYTGI